MCIWRNLISNEQLSTRQGIEWTWATEVINEVASNHSSRSTLLFYYSYFFSVPGHDTHPLCLYRNNITTQKRTSIFARFTSVEIKIGNFSCGSPSSIDISSKRPPLTITIMWFHADFHFCCPLEWCISRFATQIIKMSVYFGWIATREGGDDDCTVLHSVMCHIHQSFDSISGKGNRTHTHSHKFKAIPFLVLEWLNRSVSCVMKCVHSSVKSLQRPLLTASICDFHHFIRCVQCVWWLFSSYTILCAFDLWFVTKPEKE